MKSADGLMGPGPPLASKRVLDWLLEDDQPAVQYLTLKDLVGKAEDDPEVQDAKELIPKKGWAADVLARQNPEGWWVGPESLYQPKYLSTNWMLLILSDLALTMGDPRIERYFGWYRLSGPTHQPSGFCRARTSAAHPFFGMSSFASWTSGSSSAFPTSSFKVRYWTAGWSSSSNQFRTLFEANVGPGPINRSADFMFRVLRGMSRVGGMNR